MATIVNTTVFRSLAIELGWDNLSAAEVGEWLRESGINPAGVVAFMRAIVASPNGLDDTTLGNTVDPSQVPYIEDWFRAKGYVF